MRRQAWNHWGISGCRESPFFVFLLFTTESAETAEEKKNNQKQEESESLKNGKTVIPDKRNVPLQAFITVSKSLRSLR